MPPEPIARIVAASRRRLIEMRILRRSVAAIGVVAAAGTIVLAIGRRVVVPWAEAAVVAAGLVSVIAAIAWTVLRRPSERHAAIELDSRLGSKDQVSTALELSSQPTVTAVEAGQVARAAAWAEGRSLEGFGSVVPPRRLALLTTIAVVAAILLAVPSSPADAEQARRAEVAAAVEEAVAEIEEAQNRIADSRAGEELARAAEELQRAEDLEDAIHRLGDARQRLADLDDPGALSFKTALAAAEQRLRQTPLGAGEDLASQLRSLAEQAPRLDGAEREQAAEQLAELSELLSPTAPELGDALRQAAGQLQAGGDPAAALATAADAAAAAADRVQAADDVAEARSAVRRAQEGLGEARNAGEGQGQGQGQVKVKVKARVKARAKVRVRGKARVKARAAEAEEAGPAPTTPTR